MEVHALFVENASLLPQIQHRSLLLDQRVEFVLDFVRVLLLLEKILSGLVSRREAVLASVNLALRVNHIAVLEILRKDFEQIARENSIRRGNPRSTVFPLLLASK